MARDAALEFVLNELRDERIDVTLTLALSPCPAEVATRPPRSSPPPPDDLPGPPLPETPESWTGEHSGGACARPDPLQPLAVLALRALAEAGKMYVDEEDRQLKAFADAFLQASSDEAVDPPYGLDASELRELGEGESFIAHIRTRAAQVLGPWSRVAHALTCRRLESEGPADKPERMDWFEAGVDYPAECEEVINAVCHRHGLNASGKRAWDAMTEMRQTLSFDIVHPRAASWRGERKMKRDWRMRARLAKALDRELRSMGSMEYVDHIMRTELLRADTVRRLLGASCMAGIDGGPASWVLTDAIGGKDEEQDFTRLLSHERAAKLEDMEERDKVCRDWAEANELNFRLRGTEPDGEQTSDSDASFIGEDGEEQLPNWSGPECMGGGVWISAVDSGETKLRCGGREFMHHWSMRDLWPDEQERGRLHEDDMYRYSWRFVPCKSSSGYHAPRKVTKAEVHASLQHPASHVDKRKRTWSPFCGSLVVAGALGLAPSVQPRE